MTDEKGKEPDTIKEVSNTLLPCPFCGSAGVLEMDFYGVTWSARCSKTPQHGNMKSRSCNTARQKWNHRV